MNLNNLEVVSECGILLIQKQIVNKQYTLHILNTKFKR